MTAEHLYTLVRDKKVTYDNIKDLEPKKFQDLEYTMKLIFNHDEELPGSRDNEESSLNNGS